MASLVLLLSQFLQTRAQNQATSTTPSSFHHPSYAAANRVAKKHWGTSTDNCEGEEIEIETEIEAVEDLSECRVSADLVWP